MVVDIGEEKDHQYERNNATYPYWASLWLVLKTEKRLLVCLFPVVNCCCTLDMLDLWLCCGLVIT